MDTMRRGIVSEDSASSDAPRAASYFFSFVRRGNKSGAGKVNEKIAARARSWHLSAASVAILALMAVPFFCGLAFIIGSSFGITPTWQESGFTASHWQDVFSDAVFRRQLAQSFVRANAIAAASLAAVFFAGFWIVSSARNSLLEKISAFTLSVPHVAFAAGFMFLLAPSGFLFRVAARIFNFSEPPNITTVNDALGIAVAVAVLIKVTPFILFSLFGALKDHRMADYAVQGRLMGHGRFAVWSFVVFPQVFPKIMLPFFISLCYALSPIDMAAILGPYTPPSSEVSVSIWFLRPDRLQFIRAAIGCVLIIGLSALSLGLWMLVFAALKSARSFAYAAARHIPAVCGAAAALFGQAVFAIIIFCMAAALALIATWSLTSLWTFPDLLPTRISLAPLRQYGGQLLSSASVSAAIALCAAALSLAFVFPLLEFLSRPHGSSARSSAVRAVLSGIIFIPLLAPSIAYVAGVRILFLYAGISGTFFAVVWAHMQYVLPYVFLVLYGPFVNFDERYVRIARSMGKSAARCFFAVKLPMLLRPVAYAAGIGVLVSLGQYLPTLFVGEGKFQTPPVYMVTLSSGGSRAALGLAGLELMALNALALAAAFAFSKMQRGTKDVSL